MKFYWTKTNVVIRKLFSNYVWNIPNEEKKIYLTFDDGPTPKITNWILDQLKGYNAKATFFCVGNNIESNIEIYKNIIKQGHSIGNHTFNHLNGWKTNNQDYIENVEQSKNLESELFRPPYGKIKPSQSKIIRKLGYKIIMWDILSADFDITISPEKCLENVISNIEPGSIIVFHDSQKAFKNLEYTLPRTLEFLNKNGFICESIKFVPEPN